MSTARDNLAELDLPDEIVDLIEALRASFEGEDGAWSGQKQAEADLMRLKDRAYAQLETDEAWRQAVADLSQADQDLAAIRDDWLGSSVRYQATVAIRRSISAANEAVSRAGSALEAAREDLGRNPGVANWRVYQACLASQAGAKLCLAQVETSLLAVDKPDGNHPAYDEANARRQAASARLDQLRQACPEWLVYDQARGPSPGVLVWLERKSQRQEAEAALDWAVLAG